MQENAHLPESVIISVIRGVFCFIAIIYARFRGNNSFYYKRPYVSLTVDEIIGDGLTETV